MKNQVILLWLSATHSAACHSSPVASTEATMVSGRRHQR